MDRKATPEILAHFSSVQSPELVDYINNVAFLSSRYIFTRRQGKHQYGYCTHCHNEYHTHNAFGRTLYHNEEVKCPSCKSRATVKSSGRKRTQMVDDAYVVYYEPSLTDPKAITARGIYAMRDFRDEYRAVETLFYVKAMYLFQPGRALMLQPLWSHKRDIPEHERWYLSNTVSSLAKTYMAHKAIFVSQESIRTAVQGTPFRYSTWEHYTSWRDMVKFFELAAKYPSVEYLTKLGMNSIVEAKIDGERTYGVVNWRGKNPLQVLKLRKDEIHDLRKSGVEVTPWLIYLYRCSKHDGSNFTITELVQFGNQVDPSRHSALQRMLTHTTLRRFDAYLVRQLRNPEVVQHYHTRGQLLQAWDDYVGDCKRLGLDLNKDSVLFPRNLYTAHQNTIAQVKVKEDALLTAQIVGRAKELEKLSFEALGFILRPARSTKELIAEGKALDHCVGTYAEEYARGRNALFFLRRATEPDKPFYTMEIQKRVVQQCRGKRNCVPTPEVQKFVDLFVATKLTTKRTKVGIAG